MGSINDQIEPSDRMWSFRTCGQTRDEIEQRAIEWARANGLKISSFSFERTPMSGLLRGTFVGHVMDDDDG